MNGMRSYLEKNITRKTLRSPPTVSTMKCWKEYWHDFRRPLHDRIVGGREIADTSSWEHFRLDLLPTCSIMGSQLTCLWADILTWPLPCPDKCKPVLPENLFRVILCVVHCTTWLNLFYILWCAWAPHPPLVYNWCEKHGRIFRNIRFRFLNHFVYCRSLLGPRF